jgi:predicted branched-subunit amino acid permease
VGDAANDARAAAARTALVRRALSVGFAPSLYGFSLGALGVANGLSLAQTCATSLLLFSGGSQFALIGILGAGGSAASAITTSSLLGIRNGLYGLQMNRILHPRGLRKLVVAQLTIDESTAVAITQDDPALQRLGFWITGVAIFCVWNITTLLGALAGNAMGDPRRYGLDAAASAAFLALLWPRLTARDPIACAVAAAVLTTALVPALPVGLPVIAAALVAVVVGGLREWRPPR